MKNATFYVARSGYSYIIGFLYAIGEMTRKDYLHYASAAISFGIIEDNIKVIKKARATSTITTKCSNSIRSVKDLANCADKNDVHFSLIRDFRNIKHKYIAERKQLGWSFDDAIRMPSSHFTHHFLPPFSMLNVFYELCDEAQHIHPIYFEQLKTDPSAMDDFLQRIDIHVPMSLIHDGIMAANGTSIEPAQVQYSPNQHYTPQELETVEDATWELLTKHGYPLYSNTQKPPLNLLPMAASYHFSCLDADIVPQKYKELYSISLSESADYVFDLAKLLLHNTSLRRCNNSASAIFETIIVLHKILKHISCSDKVSSTYNTQAHMYAAQVIDQVTSTTWLTESLQTCTSSYYFYGLAYCYKTLGLERLADTCLFSPFANQDCGIVRRQAYFYKRHGDMQRAHEFFIKAAHSPQPSMNDLEVLAKELYELQEYDLVQSIVEQLPDCSTARNIYKKAI